jgi:hypothetical protein
VVVLALVVVLVLVVVLLVVVVLVLVVVLLVVVVLGLGTVPGLKPSNLYMEYSWMFMIKWVPVRVPQQAGQPRAVSHMVK